MPDSPLLEVQGLRLELQNSRSSKVLVEDLCFGLLAGRTLALVGESGSGKTLTALSLFGLLPPRVHCTAGSIRFQGTDLCHLRERALARYRGSEVGYIFQDPSSALNPVLRVGTQVEEVLLAHRPELKRAARKAQVLQLLQEVELPDCARLARRYPHQLSGGQRQRVLIAAALAGNPKLLIADEPTTALDVTVQEQVLRLLDRLRQERGLAMLWISHDLQLVRAFCQEAIVMKDGRVVEKGPPAALFRDPQHPYTQELVGAALAGQQAKSTSSCPAMEVSCVCRVRGLKVCYPDSVGRRSGGQPAVRGVDLEIHRAQTLALVGESGSGKTTVGRALLRMLPLSAGQILMRFSDGQEVDWSELSQKQLRPLRRHLGMVFQDPISALDPRRCVWQSVAEPLAIHGVAKGSLLRKRALSLLADVGLGPDHADALPSQLSGGQCQRVAIARAIALEPSLVICDEAISSLDAHVQEQILELLADLQTLRGIAYLFISHDLDAVRHFADQVAVMHEGLIVEQGPVVEVLSAPEHPYTRRLLRAAAAVHSAR